MSYTSQKDRGTKASKSSWLITLLISLVALVAVGCGDSNEDYVFTGTNPGPANTGNVTFQFERLVAAKIGVPTATQTLEFEFYDSNGFAIANGNGVANPFFSTPYADTVTVPNVPVNAVEYVVTARTGGTPSVPLAEFSDDLTVVAGSTVVVDPTGGTATPITFGINAGADFNLAVGATKQLVVIGTFSNGETYTATAGADFASSNAAVAVSATGLVTGVSAGSAVVTATVELLGVDYTDTVNVTVGTTPPPSTDARLEFSPASVTLNTSATANVTVTYFAANSTTGVNVTAETTGVASTGLNATYTAGVVAAGNTTGTGTINVTYTSGNVTVTAPLSVTINAGGTTPPPAPGAARLEVNPSAVTITTGGTSGALEVLYFAAGATEGVPVTAAGATAGVFSNGTAGVVPTAFTYDAATRIVTAPAGLTAGDAVDLVVRHTPAGASAPLESDPVRITIGTPVVTGVEIVSLEGDTLRLPTGGSQYRILAVATTSDAKSALADLNAAPWSVVLADPSVANQAAGGGGTSRTLTTTATPGTSLVTIKHDTLSAVTDSFTLTTFASATATLTVAPAPISVAQGGRSDYTLVVTYVDGSKQDFTRAVGATATGGTGLTVGTEVLGAFTLYTGEVLAAATATGPGTLTPPSLTAGTLSGTVGARFVGVTVTNAPANAVINVTPAP